MTDEFKKLLDRFNELEGIFKTLQLTTRRYSEPILHEYRYCARAIVSYLLTKDESEKSVRLQEISYSLSVALHDMVDLMLRYAELTRNNLKDIYGNNQLVVAVNKLLGDKFIDKYVESISWIKIKIIDSRRTRDKRYDTYLIIARSDHFENLKRFCDNIDLIELSLSRFGDQKSPYIDLLLQAVANMPGKEFPRFQVLYQPKFKCNNNKYMLTGFEALLRLQENECDDQKSWRSPGDFLEILHLIERLEHVDRWVRVEVVNLVRDNKKKITENHLKFSVNVAPHEVGTSFSEHINDLLCDSGLRKIVVLELTEEWARDPEIKDKNAEVTEIMRKVAWELRRLHYEVELVIDDFGAGDTKLSFLIDLPQIKGLKIDRTITNKLITGDADIAEGFIGGIADLARKLKLKICFEGVESTELVERLEAVCPSIEKEYQG